MCRMRRDPLVRTLLMSLFAVWLIAPACGADAPTDPSDDAAADVAAGDTAVADDVAADAPEPDATADASPDAPDATADADTATSDADAAAEDAARDTGDDADAAEGDTSEPDAADAPDAADVAEDVALLDGTVTLAPELLGIIAGNPDDLVVTFETPSPRSAPAIVTFAGVPDGVTLTPDTVSIPADATSATVSVASSVDAEFANTRITVTVSDGTYAGSAEVPIIVNVYPNITIAYAPDPLSVARGDAATLTATLTREPGWPGAVDIAVLDVPAGVTITPNPLRVLAGETIATATVEAALEAEEGTTTLTLESTIPLRTRRDTLALELLPPAGFEVVTPDARTVVRQGASTTVSVGINGDPAAYPVAVTATVVPEGLTVSSGTIDAAGASATLTVEADADARLAVPARVTVELSDGTTASTGSFDVAVAPAEPNPLDLSFGVEGVIAARVGTNNVYYSGVNDGDRLVLSGGGGQVDAFLADGSRDVSFGDAGSYLHRNRVQFRCLVQDDSGRFVAAGVGGSDLVFVRLTSDGALDASYGEGGVTTVAQRASLDSVDDCTLDADGRLLVTSNAGLDAADLAVIRLTAAGTPDDTFGDGGRALVDLGLDEYAYRVTVDASGRVLVAGYQVAIGPVVLFVVRLSDSGTRDTSFGADGVVEIPELQYPVALSVLPDGAIAVIGTGGGGTVSARLSGTDGAVDTTFGADGFASVLVGPNFDNASSAVFDDAGGAWVSARFGIANLFGVMRLDPSGALDPAFSDDGWAAITLGDPSPIVGGLVVDAPGVFVFGSLDTYGVVARFAE